MEPCPVCEAPHPPGALECAVCGKVFAAGHAAAVAGTLDGLEPTRHVPPADTALEAVPGLETTSLATPALAAVPAVSLPDLETTQLPDPAGAVAVAPPPDFEQTLLDPTGGPTVFGPVMCRGCGAVGQEEGLFCNRCGRRLPRVQLQLAEAQLLDDGASSDVPCRSCGARHIVHGICVDCGVPQRPS